MTVSGSVRNLTLDGISFPVAADANLSEMGSQFENDMVPTSGDNLLKKTKRAQKVEGVVLIVDSVERELLRDLNDRTEDFAISYETADGTVRSTSGQIQFDTRETEENRATITLLPRGGWNTLTA
jgi:hypothetical protein